jgi:hypothetical protein
MPTSIAAIKKSARGMDAYKQVFQQSYDKHLMFNQVSLTDDATRQAVNHHRAAWNDVMWKLDHLYYKGYSTPSMVKEGNTWAKTHSCAKKLTEKGIAYKNWASRMQPYKRLYHVTLDDLRKGTYGHKV